MFGMSYKYNVNPETQVVTVRPTAKSLFQIFFWSFAPLLALMSVGQVLMWLDEPRKTTPLKNTSEEL